MKRLSALLLALVTILSLVSCSGSLVVTEETCGLETGSAEENKTEEGEIVIPDGFCVGYSITKINPPAGTGMGGYGDQETRLSNLVLDDLMLTCTAVSDGENVIFIFSSDTIHVAESIGDKVGSIAEKKFNIPAENVIINGTHTHSGPAMADTSAPGLARYLKNYYYPAAEKIMGEALRDLESASVLVGAEKTEGMNYVRRYVSKVDGSFLGKNLEAGQDPNLVAHESEADPMMRIIRFDRATKKDVILVNWQAHPTGPGGAGNSNVSSDYISTFRKTVQDAGYLFSFHQGAGGNVSISGLVEGDKIHSDYRGYGKELGEILLSALDSLTPASSGKVQAKTAKFTGTRKSGNETLSFPITVLSIGDVAFAAAPCELHDSLGVDLRERSPFAFTFFCGYTDGRFSYIPASWAFPNGGYEVESCRFKQGTGEALVDELVKMLEEIYQTK